MLRSLAFAHSEGGAGILPVTVRNDGRDARPTCLMPCTRFMLAWARAFSSARSSALAVVACSVACATPTTTMPAPSLGDGSVHANVEDNISDPEISSEAYRSVLEAELELQDGNVPEGIAHLRESVLHDPASAYLRMRLAEAWLEAGDAGQAREAGEAALAINPKHVGALRVVGRAWALAGESKKARDAYERALNAAPADRESSALLAELLVEDGDLAGAEAVIEKLMAGEPGAVDGYLSLARIFAERGEIERAFVHVERALAREPADPQALALKLTLSWSEGRFDTALPAANALARVAGAEPEVRRDVLTAHALAGKMADADALAAAWLEEDGSEDVRLAVAEGWERAGELTRAIAVLDPAKSAPLSPRSAADSARIRMQLGESARAVEVVCPLVDAPADVMVSAFVLATCARALVEVDADHLAGKGARAKEAGALIIKRAAKLAPTLGDAAPIYLDVVTDVAKAGGVPRDEALRIANAALFADPTEPNTIAGVARAHEVLGDVDGGRRILEEALRARPAHPDILFALARHLDRQKQSTAAIEIVERLLDRGKTGVEELNFIAFALADSGTRAAEAEHMAWRALVQDPLNGYVVDTLGWTLFAKGDYAAAVATLQRADRLSPREGELLFHLAAALEKKGDAVAALETAEKAKALLRADDPVLARVAELLARLASTKSAAK